MPAATRQSSPTTKFHQKRPNERRWLMPRPPPRRRAARLAAQRAHERERDRGEEGDHAEQRRLVARPVDAGSLGGPEACRSSSAAAPTANLIVFSGTRESGPCASSPAATTSTTAAAAPSAASASCPCALPKAITMKTTSSPSSRTPLNATVNPYQSSRLPLGAPRSRGLIALLPERFVLVVQRLVAARAQDRLAQPLQPEGEQQGADDQPQRVDGDDASAPARVRRRAPPA